MGESSKIQETSNPGFQILNSQICPYFILAQQVKNPEIRNNPENFHLCPHYGLAIGYGLYKISAWSNVNCRRS